MGAGRRQTDVTMAIRTMKKPDQVRGRREVGEGASVNV